jgi:hypothetical protein
MVMSLAGTNGKVKMFLKSFFCLITLIMKLLLHVAELLNWKHKNKRHYIFSTKVDCLHCIKVKCTLLQALRLCTGRTAHRGSRGISLPFHDHGTGRGWGVSVTTRSLFTPRKDPVPIVQETGWAPGPVSPPGFSPRTVQPVSSRYTDWAIRPTLTL